MIRNFRGVKFNRFQKNLKIFSVHLIKQKRKRLLADLRKFLPSNHYYNSRKAFWHDFGDNRKIIFAADFFHGEYSGNAKHPLKVFRANEKRTGTSACPQKTYSKISENSVKPIAISLNLCYNSYADSCICIPTLYNWRWHHDYS